MGIHILGLAGSLRRASHNRGLLERIGRHVRPADRFDIFDFTRDVPLFCEDDEAKPPPGVRMLWDEARKADLILFATPEYNQAIPAVTKNLVDWLSRDPSGSPLRDKAVAVTGMTVGTWGTRLAQQQLRGTLAACGSLVMPAPMLFLAGAGRAELVDEELRDSAGAILDWADRTRLHRGETAEPSLTIQIN